MKRSLLRSALILLLSLATVFVLASCKKNKGKDNDDNDGDIGSVCSHRDKNDDNRCDKCSAKYSDGADTGAPAACSHSAGEAVIENSIPMTCLTDGSYDEVVYCSIPGCGVELSRVNKTVSAPGAHTPAQDHVIENLIEVTCLTDGSYDKVLYCSAPGCGAVISSEHMTISARGSHTTSEYVREEGTPATCTTNGIYYNVMYCAVETCRAEIARIAAPIYSTGHTEGTRVYENNIPADCYTNGSYDIVIYCSNEGCGAELSREKKVIGPKHQYEGDTCTVCGGAKPSEGLIYTSQGNGRCYVSAYYSSGVLNCIATNVIIPEVSPYGDTVVGIQSHAFDGLNIRSISIPDTVTFIGSYAFRECRYLESIALPDSVKTIGERAFDQCEKLKNVELGSGLERIESYAFRYCESLESITIPESTVGIGSYAFSMCEKLSSVILLDPSGWSYTSSFTAVDGSRLYGVSTPGTAASYLTGQYIRYYWVKDL